MQTIAGDMIVNLPDNWADSTEYVYFSPDEECSLRISRLRVAPETTPQILLEDRLERIAILGKVTVVSRGEILVDAQPASYAFLTISDEDSQTAREKNSTIARLLVVKSGIIHAVCAILADTSSGKTDFVEIWDEFLKNLKFQRGTP